MPDMRQRQQDISTHAEKILSEPKPAPPVEKAVSRAVLVTGGSVGCRYQPALNGAFSAVSTPIFRSKFLFFSFPLKLILNINYYIICKYSFEI